LDGQMLFPSAINAISLRETYKSSQSNSPQYKFRKARGLNIPSYVQTHSTQNNYYPLIKTPYPKTQNGPRPPQAPNANTEEQKSPRNGPMFPKFTKEGSTFKSIYMNNSDKFTQRIAAANKNNTINTLIFNEGSDGNTLSEQLPIVGNKDGMQSEKRATNQSVNLQNSCAEGLTERETFLKYSMMRKMNPPEKLFSYLFTEGESPKKKVNKSPLQKLPITHSAYTPFTHKRRTSVDIEQNVLFPNF